MAAPLSASTGTPLRRHTARVAARVAGAAAAALAAALLAQVPAAATPGQVIDWVEINGLCAAQYLETPTFRAGAAYLVAPRDAYSWRCQRASTSASGGTLTDLPVDPTALCGGAAEPIPATPAWRCI